MNLNGKPSIAKKLTSIMIYILFPGMVFYYAGTALIIATLITFLEYYIISAFQIVNYNFSWKALLVGYFLGLVITFFMSRFTVKQLFKMGSHQRPVLIRLSFFSIITFSLIVGQVFTIVKVKENGLFGLKLFHVPTEGMEPSVVVGDRVVVNMFAYGHSNLPKLGDLVIYKWPKDSALFYVSRVLATPNDRIIFMKDSILLNDVKQKQRYVDDKEKQCVYCSDYSPSKNLIEEQLGEKKYLVFTDKRQWDKSYYLKHGQETPYTVADGSYFLVGDNRDNSLDSRFWGVVPQDQILGKVEAVLWSMDEINESFRWPRFFQEID